MQYVHTQLVKWLFYINVVGYSTNVTTGRGVHPPSAPGSNLPPKSHRPHQSRLFSLAVHMHREM